MCSFPSPCACPPATSVLTEMTCIDGYYSDNDAVIFTTLYTYAQVMSIIGSSKNITQSGSLYDTVSLNGTDNPVGTARTYDILGTHVVETVTFYSKPPNGSYHEVQTLNTPSTAPVDIPPYNISSYGDYDRTTVLHNIHLSDAQTVGKLLGAELHDL